jgi:hypothetical protein
MTELLDRSGTCPKNVGVRPKFGGTDEEAPRRGGARSRLGRSLVTVLLAVALVAAPSIGFADGKAAEVSKEGGLGAAAALSSLVYGPIKLIYATGGLVIGAFAWVFTAGDSQVAEKVFTRSLKGTYVITPEILVGEERLVFIGRDGDEPATRPEAVAAVAAPGPIYSEETTYDDSGW